MIYINESILFTVRQMSLSESGHKEFEFVRISLRMRNENSDKLVNTILSASYVNKQKREGAREREMYCIDLKY